MRPEIKYSLPVDSDTAIVQIRSSLLILAQTGDVSDLSSARQALVHLREQAENDNQRKIAAAILDCEAALESMANGSVSRPVSVYEVLDKIALVEAAMLEASLHSADFLDDLTSLVDVSFEDLATRPDVGENGYEKPETFAIDEETLEIFRSEAAELVNSIDASLELLVGSPSNSNAIWEIRRNSHTFKGAAGIVGLKNACRIAHKMEDLLDVVVGSGVGAGKPVVDFLLTAVETLHSILDEKPTENNVGKFNEQFAAAERWLKHLTSNAPQRDDSAEAECPTYEEKDGNQPRISVPKTSPAVRVSLDRVDQLMKLSSDIASNGKALESLLNEFLSQGTDLQIGQPQVGLLLKQAGDLHRQLQSELGRVRLVRFGTIETRLSRAINNTCGDVSKKASLELENGDTEIDTLVIDALVEPLIHLLKNSVVHGIEDPETRRLIGKPETGTVTVRVEADNEAVILTVSDDGAGIAAERLKRLAVTNGVITDRQSESLNDREALKLVFEKGLTTSDTIDLNAGRGVGMAIVKESVESRGGSVIVDSQPTKGTTFTIIIPITQPEPCLASIQEARDELAAPTPIDPLILIVDDSATIRNQAVKIIEATGFRTITANNGAEALELLLSGKWEPDLILSDVEMPQIDGWQFLEYVKTDDNFGEIPVVMVTSLDMPKYRKRANDLGASDYIVKPITSTDLERVCREYAMPR